jgi:hypothetical protein
MPTGVTRQLVVLLSALWLVWILALTLAAPLGPEVTTQPAQITLWQSLPDQTEPMLLQAQSERSSPQLFLHAKQQPVYVLVAEPVLLLLRLLALLLPVVLVAAWFIRAGPRRSFRLALWRDANLCCKRQLYH